MTTTEKNGLCQLMDAQWKLLEATQRYYHNNNALSQACYLAATFINTDIQRLCIGSKPLNAEFIRHTMEWLNDYESK